jgi:hypothetical protein
LTYTNASRPAILPKPIGQGLAGAVSLGFERHQGFYELVCARLRAPGGNAEFVSKDYGYIDVARRSSAPPARKERKIALLIFLLMREDTTKRSDGTRVEVARGGPQSWCHSLYRLSVHNPKDGGGNKWLGATFGLDDKHLDEPFSGVLRFVQCRRAGKEFIVSVDYDAFDPAGVTLSVWRSGDWRQSSRQRLEILYDLMRQVPRWSPLGAKIFEQAEPTGVVTGTQVAAPWEDMPVLRRYITASKRVRMVGLNHQVFRRARATWIQEHGLATSAGFRDVTTIPSDEHVTDRQRRIDTEINATVKEEPLDANLEELTVFIGSRRAHDDWLRHTGWRPEAYDASRSFWQVYLQKVSRIRPKAKVRLFEVENVSPLVLHLEFADGSSFLKWAPAMFGAYHPGNPGWNLIWNLGAPAPPHFAEIAKAVVELESRATEVPLHGSPTTAAVPTQLSAPQKSKSSKTKRNTRSR